MSNWHKNNSYICEKSVQKDKFENSDLSIEMEWQNINYR